MPGHRPAREYGGLRHPNAFFPKFPWEKRSPVEQSAAVDMSNRQSNSQAETHSSTLKHAPSGLLRAVLETGRNRGDSATPPPMDSPKPNKDLRNLAQDLAARTIAEIDAREARLKELGVSSPILHKSNRSSTHSTSLCTKAGNQDRTLNHMGSFTSSADQANNTHNLKHSTSSQSNLNAHNFSFTQGRNYNFVSGTSITQGPSGFGRGQPLSIQAKASASNGTLAASYHQQNTSFSGDSMMSFQSRPSTSGGGPPTLHRAKQSIISEKPSQRFYESATSTPPMTVAQMSTKVQKRLVELQGRVSSNVDVPHPAKIQLWNDISLFASEFDRMQSEVQKGVDASHNLTNELYTALASEREDTARVRHERDEARTRIAKQQLEIDELRVKVYVDKQNPKAAEERKKMDAMVKSYGTPDFSYKDFQNSDFYKSRMSGGGALLTKEALATYVPKDKTARPNPGPPEPATKANATFGGPREFPARPKIDPHPQMALAVFDPAEKYKDGFSDLWGMAESWSQSYCQTPNGKKDHALVKAAPETFEYLVNCTYPHARRDATSHIMALLENEEARMWFVIRVLVNYLATEILHYNAWKGFNTASNTSIQEALDELSERGLANEARQRCVGKIHSTVHGILDNGAYERFRVMVLGKHSKSLRDIVGPLLNEASDRAAAGRDLGRMVVKAWDFSAKINTSYVTFNIHFPELNSKFIAGTMIAINQRDANPTQLQIDQTRLKLVITPIVTLRDDRGTTIRAKNLHNALVLIQEQ